MLKFIGREAARRGLDFQLALWTQRYDFDDVPRANYTDRGRDRREPRALLPRRDHPAAERGAGDHRPHLPRPRRGRHRRGRLRLLGGGLRGRRRRGPAGRDRHARQGPRPHARSTSRAQSGMPITASPKYLAEHMGLPYHQSAIRDKEYPPEVARSEREQLSEGLAQVPALLLRRPADEGQGLQRPLPHLGGHAARAALGRSRCWRRATARARCLRAPTASSGASRRASRAAWAPASPASASTTRSMACATKQDWQKFAYQYRVWGRLLYNPEAPRDSWMRWLRPRMRRRRRGLRAGLVAGEPRPAARHPDARAVRVEQPLLAGDLHQPRPGRRLGQPRLRPSTWTARSASATRRPSTPRSSPRRANTPRTLLAGQHLPPLHAARRRRLARGRWPSGCETALTTARGAADFGRAEVQRILARRPDPRLASPATSPSASAPPAGPSSSSPPRSRRCSSRRSTTPAARCSPGKAPRRCRATSIPTTSPTVRRAGCAAPGTRACPKCRPSFSTSRRCAASAAPSRCSPTPPPTPRSRRSAPASPPSPAAPIAEAARSFAAGKPFAVRLRAVGRPRPGAALPPRQPGRALALDGDAQERRRLHRRDPGGLHRVATSTCSSSSASTAQGQAVLVPGLAGQPGQRALCHRATGISRTGPRPRGRGPPAGRRRRWRSI